MTGNELEHCEVLSEALLAMLNDYLNRHHVSAGVLANAIITVCVVLASEIDPGQRDDMVEFFCEQLARRVAILLDEDIKPMSLQ